MWQDRNPLRNDLIFNEADLKSNSVITISLDANSQEVEEEELTQQLHEP